LFGVEQEAVRPTVERHPSQEKPTPLRGITRLKAERLEREKHQKQERESPSPHEREPDREASIWDTLDSIGHEPASSQDQTAASDAMQRIQERTSEQQHEREREAVEVERERLEREKAEQERDQDYGMGFSM